MFYVQVPLFENRAVYKNMWEVIVRPGRTRPTISCLRIACWIPKIKDTLRIHDLCRLSTTTNAPQY